MSIQFIDLKTQYRTLQDAIDRRVHAVLDHGQYIMGPEVRELEARLEAYSGAKHCISVASGTDALLIALMALGIGRGDEVITSPFTFAATAEVIALVGATPVFVDVEEDTGNIDVNLVEAGITQRTKAIMPVSIYGQAADMDDINAIAAKHDIPVIEDAAQSFGADYRGKKSGNLSSIGCTSFFPSKPLGCYGDGGAIFVSDDGLAKIMREIRVHGQEKRYYHTRIGIGGRMDTLQCAILLAKLDKFDWEVEQRIALGDKYRAMLAGINGISLPVVRNDRTCVWAQFTIQTDDRDGLIASLGRANVPTAVHYPIPLHKQPVYGPLCRIVGSLEASERMARRVVSLPMHPYLDAATMQTIVHAVRHSLTS